MMMSWNSRAINSYLRHELNARKLNGSAHQGVQKVNFICNKSLCKQTESRHERRKNMSQFFTVFHQRVQFCMHPMLVDAVSTTPMGTCPRSITFSLFSRAFRSSDSTKSLSCVLVTLPKDTQKSMGSPHMLFRAIARRPGLMSVL